MVCSCVSVLVHRRSLRRCVRMGKSICICGSVRQFNNLEFGQQSGCYLCSEQEP